MVRLAIQIPLYFVLIQHFLFNIHAKSDDSVICETTRSLNDPQLQKDSVAFVVERSLNKNVLVYEGLYNEDHTDLDDGQPIDVYWLDLDPTYVARNRNNGKMDDRDELNAIERKLAYGVTWEKVQAITEQKVYDLKLAAIPQRKVKFQLIKGKPSAIIQINGIECILQSIYVNLKANIIGFPKVIDVLLKGVSIEAEKFETEKIVP
jgi:hypothetical protein